MAVNMTETIDLTLTVGEVFISASGKRFTKGEDFSVAKEEGLKLLSVQDDYGVHFFKKVEGSTKKSAPKDVANQAVLPTQEEIAQDMAKDSEARHAAAVALDKADAAATGSRGTETGELDTAAAAPQGRRGRAVQA